MNCDGLYAWLAQHPELPLYTELLGEVDFACGPGTTTGSFAVNSITAAGITAGQIVETNWDGTAITVKHDVEDAERDAERLWNTPLTGTTTYTVQGTPPPVDYWALAYDISSMVCAAVTIAVALWFGSHLLKKKHTSR